MNLRDADTWEAVKPVDARPGQEAILAHRVQVGRFGAFCLWPFYDGKVFVGYGVYFHNNQRFLPGIAWQYIGLGTLEESHILCDDFYRTHRTAELALEISRAAG